MAAVGAGTAEATEPVGTGPFVFSDFNPDDNFVVTANPDYWLEAPDGRPYPYLDEIEFVVQNENQTRTSAIISGEIDIMHMDSGDSIAQLRGAVEAGDIQMFELDERQEAGYILINQTPGTAVSDVRIRRAMAMAINEEVYQSPGTPTSTRSPTGRSPRAVSATWRTTGGRASTRRVPASWSRSTRPRTVRRSSVQDRHGPVQPRDGRAVPAVLGGGRPDCRDRPDRAGGLHR